MTIGMLFREEVRQYDFGIGHPFRGDRYRIFNLFLQKNLVADKDYQLIKAEPATEEDLLLICKKEYIEFTARYYRAAYLGMNLPSEDFFDYQSTDNLPVGVPGQMGF